MIILNKDVPKHLSVIFLAISYIFLKSGYGKISEGKFVDTLGGLLSKSVGNNPYPMVKNFLLNVAIPNSRIFATLTMWGELLTGLSIGIVTIYLLFNKKSNKLISLILLLGFTVAAFLNVVFWLALGYTSSSTETLNMLMFVIEVVGIAISFNKYKETNS